MSKVPFPHVLTDDATMSIVNNPKNTIKKPFNLRFVTDEEITDKLCVPDSQQLNQKKQIVEMVYDVYELQNIEERRKAKGDWTNWENHPTYYNTTAIHRGRSFLSDLKP